MMVLWLALAFLEVRSIQEKHFMADVIRAHRQNHAQVLLQQTLLSEFHRLPPKVRSLMVEILFKFAAACAIQPESNASFANR